MWVSASEALTLPAPRPVDTSTFPSISLNSAGVPGGKGTISSTEPIKAGGLVWTPEDAAPWGSPIGYALAAQTVKETTDD